MKRILAAAVILAGAIACQPSVTVNTNPPAPSVTVDTPLPSVTTGATIVHAASTVWGPGPASLPPGARALVVDGDPRKAEIFTMRVWLPNDYRIPPHYHPAFEHITVISGTFHLGMGDTFDMSKMTELTAGSIGAMPPGMRHYVHAAGETVIQLHAMGPWMITYVNPGDDPRNK